MLDVWQSFQGSSPRMRGAQDGSGKSGNGFRIIPADAGSTMSGLTEALNSKDHPRGCGEHLFQGISRIRSKGSSPRMRGAHLKILAIPTI